MMTFENEHTFRKFMVSKAEEEFHNRYSEAVTEIKSQFGRKYAMIIDGNNVTSAKTSVHRSPIDTRIVLGYFPFASKSHVRAAIKTAKKLYTEVWKTTEYKYRVQICRDAAAKIADRKFELAAWISYENGKNRYEAIADVDEAIDFIKYYSQEMEKSSGFIVETAQAQSNERSKSVMKPYGVWGVIAPFNFPAAILIGMSIGALITGNTVVLKPASNTPILGYLFTQIMKEPGLPAGVLNFVTGSGDIIGRAIVENQDVAGIVFTGSKEVGLKMSREYGRKLNPRPIIAEMGGKNPVVVTDSADIDKAVEGVLKAAFGYSAQKCSACSRLYIHKNIKEAFMKRLVNETKNLHVDNPLKQDSFLGPLVNSNAYNKYKKFSKIAFRDGNVLVGGTVRNNGDYKYGYYVEPTIVDGLPKNHRLFKEELFVPILCVTEYDNYNEILQQCNDSEYGLTAGIYSNRKDEIERFLDTIEAGVIYVNRYRSATTGAMVGRQSFGGWKTSGTTGKGTGGPYYLMQFLREQSQTIAE
jgi:1-pyrroline-5-carboxylate dehydrogenase